MRTWTVRLVVVGVLNGSSHVNRSSVGSISNTGGNTQLGLHNLDFSKQSVHFIISEGVVLDTVGHSARQCPGLILRGGNSLRRSNLHAQALVGIVQLGKQSNGA